MSIFSILILWHLFHALFPAITRLNLQDSFDSVFHFRHTKVRACPVVDLKHPETMRLRLLISVSIQPRTGPSKFARSCNRVRTDFVRSSYGVRRKIGLCDGPQLIYWREHAAAPTHRQRPLTSFHGRDGEGFRRNFCQPFDRCRFHGCLESILALLAASKLHLCF